MEQTLVEAKQKAEESDRLKTEFLRAVSHEIRTPMNAIVGFAEELNDPGLSKDLREQYAALIVQSSDQLLSVITDIVNMATVAAGQEILSESEMELSSVMSFLYNQFLFKAKEKNISIALRNKPEGELYMMTDESKLIQILSNLINNAIKFTMQGGVDFGYNVNGDYVEFFVSDTGVGIPEDKKENLFTSFHQLEGSKSRQYNGTGLGLSLSKAYVELLGGKIWVESEYNKGTTFNFTIPYKKLEKPVI